MILGFTGTRKGMTEAQMRTFRKDPISTMMVNAYEFHHGDCIGADMQFHMEALKEETKSQRLGIRFSLVRVLIHPPEEPGRRAWCKTLYGKILPPKPYIDRNRDIVDACDALIACPGSILEDLRSGTWATVRYARRKGKPIFLIMPNGELRIEGRKEPR